MKTFILGMAVLLLSATFVSQAMAAKHKAADEPATAPSTEPAGPSRFYGSVTAIDTTAMTFTVGEQTFVVTKDTKITKGDGSTGAFSDATVGEPARGTYVTGADGKLTANKVRFGKKVGGGKSGGKKKKDQPTTQQ